MYDILGDDQLFDSLIELAQEDPEADARPVIIQRMAELDSAFHIDDYMPQQPEATPPAEPPVEPAPPAEPEAMAQTQPEPVPPQQPVPPVPQQPVQEGAVKQLGMDMHELNDLEFFQKYKKTKSQMRDRIGPTFTKRRDRHEEEMAKLKSLLSRLNA